MLGYGVMVALVLTTDVTPPTSGFDERSLRSVLLGVVAAGLGVGATLAAGTLSSRVRFEPLSYLGRNSLPIFLAHIVFSAGCRILMTLLGVDNLTLHIAVGLTAGVTLPLLLLSVAARARAGWLFDAPRAVNRRP